MNARDEVNGWLRDLSSRNRSMRLDETGRCFLLTDNQMGIGLFVPDAGNHLYLYCDLMAAPTKMTADFYEYAMTFNTATDISGGLSIGFEPQSRQLMAILARDTNSMDALAFHNVLLNMENRAALLRDRLAAPELPVSANATAPFHGIQFGGVRV